MHLPSMRPVQIREMLPINTPGRLGGVKQPKALEDQKKPGEDPMPKDPGAAVPEVEARVPVVKAAVPEAVDPVPAERVVDPMAEVQVPA